MRIGTRGSALALAQARLVAGLLAPHLPGARPPEIVTIAAAGDRESAVAHHPQGRDPEAEALVAGADAGGDKSRWVHELERALGAGEIDLAVHSAKDVPGELGDGLDLLGAPARAAPEDVLCGAGDLEQLPAGARIGTSSLRRAAQLRAAREDLEVVAVGGNVDTRLRKLRGRGSDAAAAPGGGHFDALVLARAGLQRLEREAEIGAVLDPTRFVPSPGQGTLALEGRADDEGTREAVAAITDAKAFACLQAERAVARALGADCNTPLGAYAVDAGCGCLHLRAWVGLPDGSAWVGDELVGGFYDPEQLGGRIAERLLSVGAGDLLADREIHQAGGVRR
jgi:hydroxymethylbilane synthase